MSFQLVLLLQNSRVRAVISADPFRTTLGSRGLRPPKSCWHPVHGDPLEQVAQVQGFGFNFGGLKAHNTRD